MRWPFGRKKAPNPIAIPIPEGVDPAVFDHTSAKLWRADPEEAARQTRTKGIELARLTQRRAEMVGATHYYWRTAGDSDVCAVCAARSGKRFAWKKPPEHGHPSECTACPAGWCRCYAEPILK